jgi:CubicO group peptidase (beta-lactamase class C family)
VHRLTPADKRQRLTCGAVPARTVAARGAVAHRNPMRLASTPRRLAMATALLAPPLAAQPADLATTVDRIFARRSLTTGPGCAVGIGRGGTTLLTRGYGMADLESGRAIDAETIFESGSVAKQFTATAIILLALDGKLSLDDDVRRHLPELPTYDAPITIRHLLNHTSGLREWSNLVAAQGWPRGSRVHRQEELLAAVTAQRALNYPVGATYSYTNSGFALLPTIVERVSGQSFAAFSQARIFGPLGMTQTRWRDDFTAVIPRRAPAYARDGGAWHLAMPFENVHGPGGMLTTVSDWLRWNVALDAKTLGTAWADTLVHQSRTRDGRIIRYALGITVDRYRGTREWSHGGATGGYRTFLARFPDLNRLSIAVLCNAADADASGLVHAIVDSLHPELAPRPALDTVAAEAASLDGWAGRWLMRGANLFALATVEKGRLRMAGAPAIPARAGGLYLGTGGQRVVPLDRGGDGRPRRAMIIGVEQDTTIIERVADPDTSAAALGALVGRYRNDEVDTTYEVRLERGVLKVVMRAGLVATLEPTYRDGFESPDLDNVFFTRDAKGRVTALHLASGRMWDLVFTRLR